MVTLTDLKEALRDILGFGTGEIGREGVTTALRETLDIHSAFTSEKFLAEGVDAHFNARENVDGIEASVKPSTRWTVDGITCPANLPRVAIYSKKAYSNPVFTLRSTLPALTVDGQSVWFGLEAGGAGGNGIATFLLRQLAGSIQLRVALGGLFVGAQYADITTLLPADYQTTTHRYSIEVNKDLVIFYINLNPVAYGIMQPGGRIFNQTLAPFIPPPYQLITSGRPLADMTTLLEVVSAGTALTFDLSPQWIRFSDSDPCPARVIRLYDAGTANLLAGLSIAAGSETSHPFPIFGYEGKTLNFRASEQGTLSVEGLKQTIEWREEDTMGITQDRAKTYQIESESLLARVVFTPNTYPCTISEAEVVLR